MLIIHEYLFCTALHHYFGIFCYRICWAPLCTYFLDKCVFLLRYLYNIFLKVLIIIIFFHFSFFMSWFCLLFLWGLRNLTKRKAIFLYLKQFNSDFHFLQECHSVKEDFNFWRSQWGMDLWRSHGTSNSAGVCIFIALKGKFCFQTVIQMDDTFVFYLKFQILRLLLPISTDLINKRKMKNSFIVWKNVYFHC